jgi:hypothetical protein
VAVFIWTMVALALWHFSVLVPDRFWGGIIGSLLAALAGGMTTGLLIPEPGVPTANPPGLSEALWAVPGALIALALSYAYGARREAAEDV